MRRIFIGLMTMCFMAVVQAGATGTGSFENDDAMDWAAACQQSSGEKLIADTLKAGQGAAYLEAPQGSAVVAAAEVVAAARGKPSRFLPSDLADWLKRQPKPQIAALAPLARRAIAKVKDAKNSELRQLWAEGSDKEWLAKLAELDDRLR